MYDHGSELRKRERAEEKSVKMQIHRMETNKNKKKTKSCRKSANEI